MLKTKKKKKVITTSNSWNLSAFQTKTLTTEERIVVSVNYSCSFTNSCIRVTALLEYLDLQSGGSYVAAYTMLSWLLFLQLN